MDRRPTMITTNRPMTFEDLEVGDAFVRASQWPALDFWIKTSEHTYFYSTEFPTNNGQESILSWDPDQKVTLVKPILEVEEIEPSRSQCCLGDLDLEDTFFLGENKATVVNIIGDCYFIDFDEINFPDGPIHAPAALEVDFMDLDAIGAVRAAPFSPDCQLKALIQVSDDRVKVFRGRQVLMRDKVSNFVDPVPARITSIELERIDFKGGRND